MLQRAIRSMMYNSFGHIDKYFHVKKWLWFIEKLINCLENHSRKCITYRIWRFMYVLMFFLLLLSFIKLTDFYFCRAQSLERKKNLFGSACCSANFHHSTGMVNGKNSFLFQEENRFWMPVDLFYSSLILKLSSETYTERVFVCVSLFQGGFLWGRLLGGMIFFSFWF